MLIRVIAAALLALASSAVQERAAPAGRVDVRYVANAGVLVTMDGRKLLIDVPIRDGIPP